MNRLYKTILYMATMLGLLVSCSPDEYDLGSIDVSSRDLVEGIAFQIEHDAQNPNIVYLTSLMESKYHPLWIHPQGRSQEKKVTLKMPFAGTYDVVFGVETRGGIVYGDTVRFTIDAFYAGFVDDPMWMLLTGGVGESKTWYLDLDEDAVSRYFTGPLYFYGSDDWWGNVTNGGNSLHLGLNPDSPESDSWNWAPDYAGNSWLMSAGDYGSMTFNLIDAANVIVEHKMIDARGTETGKFMIDVDAKTMTLIDAAMLHDSGRDNVVIDNWRNVRIISLTENTLQLGVLRDPVTSGEGICLLVYNFISKDYKDNWTPGEAVEPEPALPDGWKDDVSQTVSTAIKWVLSPETPFNWANLDGSLMNDWYTADSYADWTGFNSSVAASYADFSLTLNSADGSAVYIAPDGTKTEGSYTLDDKGFYTFDGVNPNFVISGGWVTLQLSAEHQWRITQINKDAAGNVKGMWVGVRDATKPEYMVYYLVPSAGGGGATDPYAAVKAKLCAHTWKIDVAGTKFGGPLTYSNPTGNFPTLAEEWTPDLPGNSWVMIDGDHGSMTFHLDGSVEIVQKTVKEGAFDQTNSLSGTWTFDGNNLKLTVSIPILHADNFTFAVVDWGDARLQSVGDDFLRLTVVRDAVLSGEGEWLFTYNYIPE